MRYYPEAHAFTETPPERATVDTYNYWASLPSWTLEEAVYLLLGWVPRTNMTAEPHPSPAYMASVAEAWVRLHRGDVLPLLERYARYKRIPLAEFRPYAICRSPRDFLVFFRTCEDHSIAPELEHAINFAARNAAKARRNRKSQQRKSAYLNATVRAINNLDDHKPLSLKRLLSLVMKELPQRYAKDPITTKTLSSDIDEWCTPGSGVPHEVQQVIAASVRQRHREGK